MSAWIAVFLMSWLSLPAAYPGAAIEELIRREILLEEAHLWRSAIDANLEILELDPKSVAAMNTIAGLHGILGEYQEEVTWALKALEVDPRFDLAYINQGNGLAGLRRLDEAEAAYRKAAEISPQDPLPVYSLAVLAEDRGEIERALSYYEQSVKLDERFEYGHFSMAAMLANLGRFEEAIAELEVVLKLNPDALDARQMLEQIEEERRRADRK
jgi:superkiller protein 3